MKLRYLSLPLAALALGGCATLAPQGNRVGQAAPGSPLLALSAPGLHAAARQAIVYKGQWETELYQSWHGRRAQAEAIYMQATAPQTSLRSPRYVFTGLTRGWRVVQQGGPVVWGTTHHFTRDHRTTFYRTFRLHGTQRACVAFERDWATVPDDPDQRPGKALFGYYCRGGALDQAQAQQIAASVRPPRATPRVEAHAGYSESALRTARSAGSPGAPTGYSAFPLLWAQMYQIGGGDLETH